VQNTDFIARSYGAGDVLWSGGVCLGLVEGGCAHLYWSVMRPILLHCATYRRLLRQSPVLYLLC